MEELIKNCKQFLAIMAGIGGVILLSFISQYFINWSQISLSQKINWLLLILAVTLYLLAWNYINQAKNAWLSSIAMLTSFIFEIIMLIIIGTNSWIIVLILAISTVLGVIIAIETAEKKIKSINNGNQLVH